MRIGEVVCSIAGRDNGRFYIITEIESKDRVKVADGEIKSIKNAKVKNIKHIKETGDVLEKIAQKLENGDQVFNSEIKSALRSYKEGENN